MEVEDLAKMYFGLKYPLNTHNLKRNEMRTLTLKPKHRDSVLFKLQAAAKSIKYHEENIAPNFDAMEQWEMKEYKIVNDIAKDNFNKLKDFMIENESVFNLMLAEYNLSVVTFIAINS